MPGNDGVEERSRDAKMHRRRVTRWRWLRLSRGISLLLPQITRERSAERRACWTTACRQACPELPPLPGTSRDPHYKGPLAAFGAPTARCRDFRLNPARASASWNYRMQTAMGFPPTTSPAPVQRAPRSPNTRRTGMMPRPSANESDELSSAEPAPAPPKAVSPQMTSHHERTDYGR